MQATATKSKQPSRTSIQASCSLDFCGGPQCRCFRHTEVSPHALLSALPQVLVAGAGAGIHPAAERGHHGGRPGAAPRCGHAGGEHPPSRRGTGARLLQRRRPTCRVPALAQLRHEQPPARRSSASLNRMCFLQSIGLTTGRRLCCSNKATLWLDPDRLHCERVGSCRRRGHAGAMSRGCARSSCIGDVASAAYRTLA